MSFRLYIELRARTARERGQVDTDADFMLQAVSHPYFDPETVAPRQVMETVRGLVPYLKWDRPEDHPENVLARVMFGYRAWCDAAREKAKLERWARADAREQEALGRRRERWERQQALEAARERSRALRDRERAVRIAWREQRLKEKEAELARQAPREPKRPSPFDP